MNATPARDFGRLHSWEANAISYGGHVAEVARALQLSVSTIRKETEPHGEPCDSGFRNDAERVVLKIQTVIDHGQDFWRAVMPIQWQAGMFGLSLSVAGGMPHGGEEHQVLADLAEAPQAVLIEVIRALSDGRYSIEERQRIRDALPRAYQALRVVELHAGVTPA